MPRSTPSERELPPLPGGKSVAHTKPKALKVRVLTWNMHDSLPKVGGYYIHSLVNAGC